MKFRNTIPFCNPWQHENGWFVATFVTGVAGIAGLMAFIVGEAGGASPTWLMLFLSGPALAVVFGALVVNHVATGLNPNQRSLALTYKRLPKDMQEEMALTRKDLFLMSNAECSELEYKMERAAKARMSAQPKKDFHGYLDSIIDTYREV